MKIHEISEARRLHSPEVDLTVLVSCYNEKSFICDTLDTVLGALCEAGISHEVIVIDDCSKDGSVEAVVGYIQSHPQLPVYLYLNETNQGLANNYINGSFVGRGKYYRLCCGDNSEPKEGLVSIFKCIGLADIVVPYFPEEFWYNRSLHRRLISKAFTWIVNFISGHQLHYYNGCAVHVRWNVMRWHPNSCGFGFQADMLTQMLDTGCTYVEVPSSTIERKGSGSSALSTRNLLSVLHTFVEVAIRRLKRELYGAKNPVCVRLPNSE
jgi:glycosyltransferase involved in cell wall biosynthesis